MPDSKPDPLRVAELKAISCAESGQDVLLARAIFCLAHGHGAGILQVLPERWGLQAAQVHPAG